MLLIKQKEKNLKRPKRIWMKPWLKNRDNRSACNNMFSELLLTDKFWHYLQVNVTSYYWLYIDFYIDIFMLLTLIQMHWLLDSYINFYNSLQYTFFIFTKQPLLYYAIKTVELRRMRRFLFKKYFTERNF